MPNFSIALTGLSADTVALNTIGNNLANLNTGAFKTQSTSFSDLFYANIGSSGSGDALQEGAGVQVTGTATDFSQGSLSTTTSSTDMALSGNGFFLVDNSGSQALTRNGDFQLDSTGNLVSSSGESVMGYGIENGAVNLNGGLIPLKLPVAGSEAASATQNVSMTTNLNSTSATGAEFSSPVTLYDSLGNTQTATVTYEKTGLSTWSYAIALPTGAATGTPANNTGTLTFDSSGNLTSPSANGTGVTFSGMADGSAPLTFNFNIFSSAGAGLVTQSAGTSNTSATTQDGYAAGAYQSFSVGSDGTLTASFSNGQTAAVGQVAVAIVINQDGLARFGSNDYITTNASGDISAGLANVGGRAVIEGDALEQSNVDISAQFSDLIVAQRAFEANSKTVTTFDSVTQDAIGMIR